MNLLKEVLYEDLEGTQKELADCIGFKTYKKLVSEFGGRVVPISPVDNVCAKARNRRICEEYKAGSTQRQLAVKYKLCTETVRKVLNEAGVLDGTPHKGI